MEIIGLLPQLGCIAIYYEGLNCITIFNIQYLIWEGHRKKKDCQFAYEYASKYFMKEQ